MVAVMPRRRTLAGQLLALQLAIIVVVLAAVAAVSLAQSAATFNRVEGRRVAALGEQLAGNPLLRDRLDRPAPGETIASLVQNLPVQANVTTVSVADDSGRIVTSTNPTLVGSLMVLGDPRVAGGRSWFGELAVGGARELVAQVPVLGDRKKENLGRHLGVVMVGEALPSWWQRLVGASSYLFTYLGIASALGVLGSWLLARRIKRQTLGLEPREIAGLAEHREALLHGLAEGVIALDPQHRVTLVNSVGRRLLDLPEHCLGRSLSELRIEGRLRDVLTGAGSARETRDQVVVRGGRVLVMSRMRVNKDGRRLGSVTTLRDRTELARLEQEIGSFRSTTESLRAQTHEFANQLHTISGLIQIGEHEEVVRYVEALSRHRASLDLAVTSRIHDTAVAALLTAKSAVAAERRVELRISERTRLGRLDMAVSADVGTVLGNLVDNAVEAVAGGRNVSPADSGACPDINGRPGAGNQWVEVELRQDSASIEIVVRDSGPGIAPRLAQEVFAHGFTTKAAEGGERGIGLALTRMVCHRRGGEVAVTNTEEGAMFTARMSVAPLEAGP
ncbi:MULTISPECIES: ATP-binding protein [unclassified Micromonospora]|uniref:histidine kinase n=3 Tax=Micromonospora aurantiaca (nom. illeg.) TaxID=47850 RepID=A0ABQ6UH46_9ACTN|nr:MULTISPECIES: ATP-binding protein [unclassified Micromonospora]KAB1114211.1 PAS domain-containing protein [Micromonospora aurantiaca]MDH6471328.1 two-component system CitB family sensor kinase [Micromonospora sp. H404/HB375]MCK1832366.1 ATP-binding protein [Micromonospora sp. R42003]MCK1843699.1 ATP-binding protein [Micromonospora sp. R42004]MCM1016732.1 ATP-binding protein [Micromonospora sp. XM-20-01]